MKDFHLTIVHGNGNLTGVAVKFGKPIRDLVTRETYREIGMLVDRIKEIGKELQTIGAVRENGFGPPKLSDKYAERSYYIQNDTLAAWKRTRAAGYSLEYHPYMLLKHKRPIDTAKINSRIKALYNEECDALIQLREFQINGIEFEFEF
jgi:hypothetical protein